MNQKGYYRDLKGPEAKAPRSGVHDAQQPPSFHALNDIFRYTTEELRSITTQYAIGNEATKLCPGLGSWAVTPRSDKEAPSDVAIHDTKKDAKGGKKRRKQRPQWVTVMTNCDDGNDEKADGSDLGYIGTTAHSGKCQVRPPTDNLERLLEEVCLNHMYPMKHKLKKCDMMKKFLISGSLTRGMELDEDPGGSNMIPFPEEDVVMMVYHGRPYQGGSACFTCVLGPRLAAVGDLGTQGCKGHQFPNIYVYIYMLICIL
jgi:hypothetical protein